MVQDEFISQGHLSTTRNLRRFLHLIIPTFHSVRIIIDGVDECDASEQDAILDESLKLASLGKESTSCKVLISSQDITTIFRKLRARSSIDLSMERGAVHNAIKSFVRGRVARSRLFADAENFNTVDKAMVEQILVDKAGGEYEVNDCDSTNHHEECFCGCTWSCPCWKMRSPP